MTQSPAVPLPADPATPERPVYRKIRHDSRSSFWMIEVDEGWRSRILGEGMYEYTADWLLGILGRRPYPDFPARQGPPPAQAEARSRSCPACHSVGLPLGGCQNLWHVEVRP